MCVHVFEASGHGPMLVHVSLLTPSPVGIVRRHQPFRQRGFSRHDQYGGPRTSQRGGLKRRVRGGKTEGGGGGGGEDVGYTVDI